MSRRHLIHFVIIAAWIVAGACNKPSRENSGVAAQSLSYGDSVFYVGVRDYDISPIHNRTGTYTAFPDNLLIDKASGKVTVSVMGLGSESQTGLRYKIRLQPAGGGEADSTYVVIAGINYLDRVYRMSQNDTIIYPIYNADISNPIPAGTYGIQADNRLSINPVNGQINLKDCIRKGLFDQPVEDGEWEELTITYKSSDKSNRVSNRIDIALYYYKTMQEIPSNVSQLMRAHQSQVLGVNHQQIPVTSGAIDTDLPANVSVSKPRPPCVIIVGN
jgi:hypothetical protein